MTDHALDVAATIEAALSSADPDQVVRGVKTAVAEELMVLSPDAEIDFTDYFNHSYMADLVVRWGSGASAVTRPVYLRGMLRPGTEADVAALETLEPMVVGLRRPIGPEVDLRPLQRRTTEARRVLVTDMQSVSRLVAPTRVAASTAPEDVEEGDDADDRLPDGELAPRTPLLQLVQANFVRGGRGLVGAEEVQQLTAGATTADTSSLSDATLRAFQEAAGALFVEDAALRLRRAAEVLRRGVVSDEPGEMAVPLEGSLSEVELRVLIPYLLKLDRVNHSPAYWRTLGEMMDLEMLEALWPHLAGVDVTPLAVPNLRTWTAKRAQLTINADLVGDEYEDADEGDLEDPGPAEPKRDVESAGEDVVDASEGRSGRAMEVDATGDENAPAPGPWRVAPRGLNVEAGPWRVWFATDSRKLRGRDEGRAARWSEVAPKLGGYRVQSVDLLGVARRIAVSAEQAGNVQADVDMIRDTIDDEFHVEDLAVQIGEGDDAPVVDLALPKMTATARRPETLAHLLAVSLDVLGHREPTAYDHLLTLAAAHDEVAEPGDQ